MKNSDSNSTQKNTPKKESVIVLITAIVLLLLFSAFLVFIISNAKKGEIKNKKSTKHKIERNKDKADDSEDDITSENEEDAETESEAEADEKPVEEEAKSDSEPEEDYYETRNRYYDEVLKESGAAKKVFTTDCKEGSLHIGTVSNNDAFSGLFEDFDGDGKNELVTATVNYLYDLDIKESTPRRWVRAEQILWFVDENGAVKVDTTELNVTAGDFEWSTGFIMTDKLKKHKRSDQYIEVIFERCIDAYDTRKYIFVDGKPVLVNG